MARIENVNIDGTDYDVGKIASTSDLGVVQVGSGLTISSGGVLSATGGGVADSVAWGHVTGTMADQTDLTTALNAKANSADLATVATSGDYDDLTDKPTIGNATLTIQKNGTSAGTFTANATSNKTINITVPTTAADVSALPASTKYGASIAVSINTTDYKVTTTLKDQDGNTLGTAQVIDLPLESVVVNGSYDSTNKKIVLTLQNGNTIDIPVGDLVAGLQSEITSTNKLASDLVDDTGQTNKFMTSAEKTKLSGIAAGAEVNVQSDWNQTTTTADDYIKNKPTKVSDFTNDAGYITSFTDTQVTQTRVDPSAITTFYPVASTSSTTNTGDVKKFSAVKLNYINDDGGRAELELGQNSYYDPVYGELTLWDVGPSSQHKTTLRRALDETNQTFYFPYNADSTGGTLVANGSLTAGTGSATNPVYADSEGILHATTYALNATVPSNAVFTDTTYSDATTSTAGLMSASDKTKLNGIAAGAEVNVQANWTQTTTTADDYIKNKPTLATVATSGSYNDLSNKPTIPTVNNGTLTIQKNGTNVQTFTANQATNATANITVPTKTSDLTNDSGFLDSVAWGDVTGKPTFATVATSGSYNDLSNKPTIPAAQVQSNWTQTTTTAVDYIKNKPTLATVATSGSYNDLSNKPTIPTVNNATLTIQKNGSTVKTFTANASSNVTANITVPTKTSDLTNDSNFVASTALATVATSGSYNDLSNKPTIPTVNDATLTIQKNGTNVQTFTANASSNKTANIIVPTKTSDITNDSGFIIAEDIASTSALTPPVTTGMIADGAVTPSKIDSGTNGIVNSQVIDLNDGLRIMTLTTNISPVFSNSTISADLTITLPGSFADMNYIVIPQIVSPGSGYYVMWIYGCVVRAVNQIAISCVRPNPVNQTLPSRLHLIAIGKKP